MLAIRDQENLVHGHQTAAAAKPLNGGIKQLNPKTPGNKAPKTPFKIPLNDENDANNFLGGGKSGMMPIGKGNATAKKHMLGDKNAFITPLGPRTRAPLGQKTTNAKAKGFQTPGAPLNDDIGKSKQKSASATTRKPKPRVSHTEAVKVDVLADTELEERDIEYMPPKVKNMPDIPDDGPHSLNLSMFDTDNIAAGSYQYFMNRPQADGISLCEHEAMKQKLRDDRDEAIQNARFTRDMDLLTQPCLHIPECLEEECKDEPSRKRNVEFEYQKTIATIRQPKAAATKLAGTKPTAAKPAVLKTRAPATSGPSVQTARKVSSALSMPKASPIIKPILSAPKARFPASLLGAKKPTAPISPDPKRHASELRASSTTLGYSQGRKASATLRKTVLPPKESKPAIKKPDTSLAPAIYIERYGAPPIGSDLWVRFNRLGCFDEGSEVEGEAEEIEEIHDTFQEEAEAEFVLTL